MKYLVSWSHKWKPRRRRKVGKHNFLNKYSDSSLTGQNGFNDYQEQPQPVYEPLPGQELNPPQYPDEKEIYNQYGPGQFFWVFLNLIYFVFIL